MLSYDLNTLKSIAECGVDIILLDNMPIDTMKKALMDGVGIGRKLDFIAQEMNREANTTLSKANSLSVADTAIALKTEIEKVREQVQNIE